MYFLQKLAIGLLAATSVLAAPPKGNKDNFVYKVPFFTSSVLTGRQPPPGYVPQRYFNFTVIDVHDQKDVKVKPWDTFCYLQFEYPPRANNRSACNEPSFTWYFSEYYSINNFSLRIQHTYKDPAYGPKPITFYGHGSPINFDTTHRIQYVCAASGAGCFAEFNNETYPIIVPITDVR